MMERRVAEYSEDDGLSFVYVYVTLEEDFPQPEDLVSIGRDTEITLDYQRSTGQLLGIEIITKTKKDQGVSLS